MTKAFRTNLTVFSLLLYQLFLSYTGMPALIRILPVDYATLLLLSQILTFILPTIVYFLITKEDRKETLSLHKLGFGNAVFVLIISFLIQPFMSMLSVLTSMIFPNNVSYTLSATMEIPLLPMILGMAVAPAICEETMFRGIVFSGFRRLGFLKAALAAGFLFGIMHMDGQQFLYAAAMGTVFCYLVHETGSIFASMLSHFTINASQIISARLLIETSENMGIDTTAQLHTTLQETVQLLGMLLPGVIVSIILLGIVIYFFHRHNRKEHPLLENNSVSWEKETILNIPFFAILLLYIVVVIVPLFFGYFME